MEASSNHRSDVESRTRLSSIQKEYELWSMRTFKTLIAIVIVQVILGAGSIYLWTQIQDSRKDAVRIQCQDTNERHDKTVVALTKGAAVDENNAKTEAAKAEIRRRRDVTLALIDAVSPKKNCEAEVKRLVG